MKCSKRVAVVLSMMALLTMATSCIPRAKTEGRSKVAFGADGGIIARIEHDIPGSDDLMMTLIACRTEEIYRKVYEDSADLTAAEVEANVEKARCFFLLTDANEKPAWLDLKGGVLSLIQKSTDKKRMQSYWLNARDDKPVILDEDGLVQAIDWIQEQWMGM